MTWRIPALAWAAAFLGFNPLDFDIIYIVIVLYKAIGSCFCIVTQMILLFVVLVAIDAVSVNDLIKTNQCPVIFDTSTSQLDIRNTTSTAFVQLNVTNSTGTTSTAFVQLNVTNSTGTTSTAFVQPNVTNSTGTTSTAFVQPNVTNSTGTTSTAFVQLNVTNSTGTTSTAFVQPNVTNSTGTTSTAFVQLNVTNSTGTTSTAFVQLNVTNSTGTTSTAFVQLNVTDVSLYYITSTNSSVDSVVYSAVLFNNINNQPYVYVDIANSFPWYIFICVGVLVLIIGLVLYCTRNPKPHQYTQMHLCHIQHHQIVIPSKWLPK
jgi:hypothetical protein